MRRGESNGFHEARRYIRRPNSGPINYGGAGEFAGRRFWIAGDPTKHVNAANRDKMLVVARLEEMGAFDDSLLVPR